MYVLIVFILYPINILTTQKLFFWGGEKGGFGFWARPSMLRAYSWLCAQGPLLAGLRGSYRVLRIEPSLAVCKASVLPTKSGLQPLKSFLGDQL